MLWKQPIFTSLEGRELVEISRADKLSLHPLISFLTDLYFV